MHRELLGVQPGSTQHYDDDDDGGGRRRGKEVSAELPGFLIQHGDPYPAAAAAHLSGGDLLYSG